MLTPHSLDTIAQPLALHTTAQNSKESLAIGSSPGKQGTRYESTRVHHATGAQQRTNYLLLPKRPEQ